MKISKDIKEYREVVADVTSNFDDKVHQELADKLSELNGWRLFFLKLSIFWQILLLPTLIVPILRYFAKISAAQIIRQNIEPSEYYNRALQLVPSVDFVAKHSKSSSALYNYRVGGIPNSASIDWQSNQYTFQVFKEHNFQTAAGLFSWKVGKYRTYKASAYIAFEYVALSQFQDFDFSVRKSIQRFKANDNHNLENNEFNKRFIVEAENDLQVRMLFTPLVMEKYIERMENRGISEWSLNKRDSRIVIRWKPPTQLLVINTKKFDSIEAMTEGICNDIANDIAEIVDKVAYLLILPML